MRSVRINLFTFILCFGLLTTLKAQENSIIKIMPLGDSITNDGRSRTGLWNGLKDDGYNIDFVGSQHQSGIIPDPDHEGVGGATIQDVADKINGLLETYEPDYIVVMIGTNDLAWYFDETGEEVAERHDQLIQQIFDNAPNEIGLVVATIPPVTPKKLQNGPYAGEDRSVFVQDFNEVLKEHMQQRIDAGENLVIADVFTPLFEDTSAYLQNDGVHPNEAGYEIIGRVWYEAAAELLEKNTMTTSSNDIEKPLQFELNQNYPNPFNALTNISFSINQSGAVDLSVYNVMGQKVATLVDGVKTSGNFQVQWNADEMASGIYYYRLKSSGKVVTREMTLVK